MVNCLSLCWIWSCENMERVLCSSQFRSRTMLTERLQMCNEIWIDNEHCAMSNEQSLYNWNVQFWFTFASGIGDSVSWFYNFVTYCLLPYDTTAIWIDPLSNLHPSSTHPYWVCVEWILNWKYVYNVCFSWQIHGECEWTWTRLLSIIHIQWTNCQFVTWLTFIASCSDHQIILPFKIQENHSKTGRSNFAFSFSLKTIKWSDVICAK